MKITNLILFFLLALNFSQSSFASVWVTENQWSESWEEKYSNWVEQSWDDEIFMREDSILKGVATDCADATYTMRMLFSYLNKLPFKILNPARSGGFISNDLNTFDRQANSDQRFLLFVNAVNDMTDSNSLSRDTYPIAIDRHRLRPGTIYVAPGDHSFQVKKINANGVPTTYASTVPKEARYLQILNSFPFYMPKDFSRFRDGYRAFKQPEHYAMKENQLPGYSLEQYQLSESFGEDILGYGDALATKLQTRQETLNERIQRGIGNLCASVQLRAIFISWTEYRRAERGYRCFSAADYYNESTPGRDKRLKLIFDYLEPLYLKVKLHLTEAQMGSYEQYLNMIYSDHPGDLSALPGYCPIPEHAFIPKSLTLREVRIALQNGKLVSDPNANFMQRWGFEDYRPNCPSY